jgi:hypothetical protein
MNNDRQFSLCAAIAFVLLGGLSAATPAHAQASRPPFTPGSHPPGNGTAPAAQSARPSRSSITTPDSSVADKKTEAGEAFFIVGSVDPSKSQILLKRPTEVTLLVKVDAKTQFLDDAGKPLAISDFRAGDTVWVTTSGGGDQPEATRVRKGQMTVADLHRYYLDYPEIK